MERRLTSACFHFSPFSRKQKKILTWWLPESGVSDYDGIIADGAIRSGKTVCMALAFVQWSMASFDGQNFGLCGKTVGSFRRNVLSVLKQMLPTRGYKFKERRSDNLFVITKGNVTNYYYIFGGKDESSQDLIQGVTLAGILLDEVALMPESFVNQATGRCSVEGSKFWFNCNPANPAHWFKKNWIDQKETKNVLWLHFTMDDNLSLSEKIKDRYRRSYTGVFHRRYILGEWCVAEGLVYDFFGEENITEELPETGEYYISIDYGTMNPFSAGLWCVNGDKAVRVKEYYYNGRKTAIQRTDDEYCNDVEELASGHSIKRVIVDPSAASFIAALRKRGFTVVKANNDVIDGIRRTAVYLKNGNIKIGRQCVDAINEFGLYSWDDKSSEDRVIKENDHAMDDIRYFANTILVNLVGKKKQKVMWR